MKVVKVDLQSIIGMWECSVEACQIISCFQAMAFPTFRNDTFYSLGIDLV